MKLVAEWFLTDRWTGSSGFVLPMEARGLYREMLTQAWRRGARLPNDHETIRRATGCTPQEWAKCWPMIRHYWREDGDALVNDTQVEVYAEALRRAEAASARGKKGAQARAQALAQAPAQVVLKDKPPSPSPSPSPNSVTDADSESGGETPPETPTAVAPRKRAAPQVADPRVNSLKAAWLALYATATGEQPAVFNHGAWGRMCKVALKAHDEPALIQRANAFFGHERARLSGYRFEAFFRDLATYNGRHAKARPQNIAALDSWLGRTDADR